jgi:hypothetical protein
LNIKNNTNTTIENNLCLKMSAQKVLEETEMIKVNDLSNNDFIERKKERKELKIKYLTTFIIYFCSFVYVSFRKKKDFSELSNKL